MLVTTAGTQPVALGVPAPAQPPLSGPPGDRWSARRGRELPSVGRRPQTTTTRPRRAAALRPTGSAPHLAVPSKTAAGFPLTQLWRGRIPHAWNRSLPPAERLQQLQTPGISITGGDMMEYTVADALRPSAETRLVEPVGLRRSDALRSEWWVRTRSRGVCPRSSIVGGWGLMAVKLGLWSPGGDAPRGRVASARTRPARGPSVRVSQPPPGCSAARAPLVSARESVRRSPTRSAGMF